MSFDLSFILKVSSCGAELSKLLTLAVESFKNLRRLAVVWALVMFHCHIVGDFELFYGACLHNYVHYLVANNSFITWSQLILRAVCVCAKVNETEVYVDGHDFRFYSKPYYLRLFVCFDDSHILIIIIICSYMLVYHLQCTVICESCLMSDDLLL